VLKPKIGLVVIANPYEVGADEAPEIARQARTQLAKLNLELVAAEEVVQSDDASLAVGRAFRREDVDLVCLIEATWSDDHLALDILEEAEVPLVAWALPGVHTGSLCGCQQLCCVLKELDRPYRFVYGPLEATTNAFSVHAQIEVCARAAALKRKLRTARLGFIGHRTKGMTEISFDEFELKRLFGPRVVQLDTFSFRQMVESTPRLEAQAVWEKVARQVGSIESPEEDGLYSCQVYLAMKRFVEENGLAGLAVGCYPNLMGEVCLAASLLGEEDVPVGCEGDVNATLAMLMLQELTGSPVHNTDPLAVYEEDNSMLFSHCGSGGFSLAAPGSQIELSPVRLMDRGVCVLFPARPGPVTLVNLVGRRDTYRLTLLRGEAVETGMLFPGNPLRVRFETGIHDLLAFIAEEGIGHHWMAGYGEVRPELVQFCRWVGVRCLGETAA
jgi:L-fucose isomerase-like protein